MSENSPWYPEVFSSCEVLWAKSPEDPAPSWVLGKVHVTKNDSCDIAIQSNRGPMIMHDCFFIDDPRCKDRSSGWSQNGRGVFKIAQSETNRRDDRAAMEQIVRRFNALEKRFDDIEAAAFDKAIDSRVQQNRRKTQPVEV
jgi:hypothetical protein